MNVMEKIVNQESTFKQNINDERDRIYNFMNRADPDNKDGPKRKFRINLGG